MGTVTTPTGKVTAVDPFGAGFAAEADPEGTVTETPTGSITSLEAGAGEAAAAFAVVAAGSAFGSGFGPPYCTAN
jgi:hypothetical protein